jgi:hypothetical protein
MAKGAVNRARIPNQFQQVSGAPEEIRTPDPQIRSLVLYPAELRARRAHRAGMLAGSAGRTGRQGARNGVIAIASVPRWQGRRNRACFQRVPPPDRHPEGT